MLWLFDLYTNKTDHRLLTPNQRRMSMSNYIVLLGNASTVSARLHLPTIVETREALSNCKSKVIVLPSGVAWRAMAEIRTWDPFSRVTGCTVRRDVQRPLYPFPSACERKLISVRVPVPVQSLTTANRQQTPVRDRYI